MLVTSKGPQTPFDATQVSPTTFLSAAMDGTIRLWDRRVAQPVARIGTRPGVPPWCMSACWSPDGNMIYAGRRNGTVEEFDVRKARRGWEPERTLKFPVGSGPISALRPMMNGRHLVWYVTQRPSRSKFDVLYFFFSVLTSFLALHMIFCVYTTCRTPAPSSTRLHRSSLSQVRHELV